MNRAKIYCIIFPVLMFLISSINFSQTNADHKKSIEARLSNFSINNLIQSQKTDNKTPVPVASNKKLNPTDYLLRAGSYPYASSHSIAVDSVAHIIFLGSGGAVLVLDGSDPSNPVLLSDEIRSFGLVEDLFIDITTHRLYLACGEGGYEIWNVEDPGNPFLYSRNEIYYADVETPVNHVQVTDNFAIFECAWGYIHSVNVSDPYNPYQVSFNGFVGNPAHNIHIDQYGYIHATGQQKYVVLYLDASGNLYSAGSLDIYNANAVFGGSQASYIGQENILYIIYNGGYSSTDVGGITHIEVRGNLAYIINNSGLHIWDVANNDNPYLVGSATTEIYTADLYVAGNLAYVSLFSHGLRIYDVSDAENPVAVGNYETFGGTNDEAIDGNYAFIAHGDDGMSVIDISNLDYPELAASITLPGYTTGIKVKNNTAFTCAIDGGLSITDISDPLNPVLISSTGSFNGSVLEVGDNLAFVEEIISTQSSFIRIFDISDLNNPVEINSLEFSQIIRSLLYKDGYLFVPAYDDGLFIYNMNDPLNPVFVTNIYHEKTYDVFIKNNILFLTSGTWPSLNGGLHLYDITDLSSPIHLSSYAESGFFPGDVEVKNEFAYVSDGDEVWLFLIDNNNPVFIEEYDLPDLAYNISAVDQYVYAADGDAGLYVLQNDLITNPVTYEWTYQQSGTTSNIWDIKMLDVSNGFASAEDGIILKTTNGGADWQTTQLVTTGDDFRCLDFSNNLKGWSGTETGRLFRTVNGGDTWTEQSIPSTGSVRDIEFVNESTGWIISMEDHYLFKTTDGGETWNNQNTGLTGTYRYFNIYFVDENVGYVMGAFSQSFPWTYFVIKTTNGGNNWSTSYSTSIDLSAIYFTDQNVGVVGGLFGDLLKTTDGGINWQYINNYGEFTITDFCFTDSQNGWFTGSDGKLFRTTDAGDTWTENDLLIPNYLRAIDFTDAENGWIVGNNGIVLRTGNSVVPVELISFVASYANGKVQLSWSTASETNNRGFEVQRNTPLNPLSRGEAGGRGVWEKVGFVEGNGTTTEKQSYSFVDKDITSGQYQYRLKQTDYDGTYKYSKVIEVDLSVPLNFSLSQNYPNPFNPSTTIKFSVPAAGKVTLTVFNILGEKVADLIDEVKEAGSYKINFNASELPSGTYLYQMKAEDPANGTSFVETKKMILIK